MGARFSSDGRKILVFGLKGARIYDAARSTPLTALMPHRERVIVAEFSPDSRWVATGSEDATARIWDVRTGYPVTEPLPNHGQVHGLSWLPGSRQLLTASEDNRLRRWTLPGTDAAADWLAELAEALAGKRSEAQGGSVAVPTDQLDAIRRRATAKGDSPDQRWLPRFLLREQAVPDSRPDEE